jgi:uncharacterized membrane protein
MGKKVLYLGDTTLDTAAAYLAGVMDANDIEFDYLASNASFSDGMLGNGYAGCIISDYPAENFTGEQLSAIASKVSEGMGLLMIGGWESFSGADRQYTDTILKEVLPVIMTDGDDRVNSSEPCLIEKVCEHEIIGTLPFETNAPAIGGYNNIEAKPNANVILRSQRFNAGYKEGKFGFETIGQPAALLVTGSYGKGRVCAFATDAAPHWIGGLVDWGNKRVHAQASGAGEIEVGNWYASLFSNMIKWIASSR